MRSNQISSDRGTTWRLALAGLALALVAMFGAEAQAQVHDGVRVVDARLVASVDAVVPGQSFVAGLHMKMAPHWHTYWQYPGDAGLPAKIEWQLPPGFKVGDIRWPLPRRIEGDLTSYAYEDEVLLMFEVNAPSEITAEEVTLSGKAEWLVCKDVCIPGGANVSLSLPVRTTASRANGDLFAKYEALLPQLLPREVSARWGEAGAREMKLEVRVAEGWNVNGFFPLPPDGVQIGAPNAERPEAGRGSDYVIPVVSPPAYKGGIPGVVGVIRADGTDAAYRVEGSRAGETESGVSDASAGTEAARFVELGGGTGHLSLPLALFYAFLGGLILNLMPCVLPAIALKIFGFVEQAGESRRRILLFGVVFVAGIFAWFGMLSVIAVLLKLNGVDLNWGFMFQHAWLVLTMGAMVLAFALNLFGVFEIQLPGAASVALSQAASKKGLTGTFLHGVFATMLATPCTAPYLGASLGFAFTQPVWIIPLIFAAVASGMGLPYVLLAVQPRWLAAMPKPGPWMERLKQFMGFLLLAVLAWILWLLARQRGPDAVGFALMLYLLVAVVCWVAGASFTPVATKPMRRWGWAGTILAVAAMACLGATHSSSLTNQSSPESQGSRTLKEGGIAWDTFSREKLDAVLRESQRPVFIDFTADWCWTCKVNERTILRQRTVVDAFNQGGFVMLKADWTNGDPEITAELKRFVRNGVPLYVLYPADRKRPAIVLPELITPGIVMDGIREALGAQVERRK